MRASVLISYDYMNSIKQKNINTDNEQFNTYIDKALEMVTQSMQVHLNSYSFYIYRDLMDSVSIEELITQIKNVFIGTTISVNRSNTTYICLTISW